MEFEVYGFRPFPAEETSSTLWNNEGHYPVELPFCKTPLNMHKLQRNLCRSDRGVFLSFAYEQGDARGLPHGKRRRQLLGEMQNPSVTIRSIWAILGVKSESRLDGIKRLRL